MATYLVFGDLHGRILPAFRLATAWSRTQGIPLAGALQVGDLGYFPDLARLDRATKKHAARDPSELGCQQVVAFTPEADAVFADPDAPPALWFTAGNHEDYAALEDRASAPGASTGDFAVDLYDRVRCIRDGCVAELPGGLRVGALWGVDDQSPSHRRNLPLRCYIRPRSARDLSALAFDVLLCHDSPPDFVFPDSGSALIESVVRRARPAFAFCGHYHPPGGALVTDEIGPTQIFHLHGMEMRGRGSSAEVGSVGVLTWDRGSGRFEYLDPAWLATFSRFTGALG